MLLPVESWPFKVEALQGLAHPLYSEEVPSLAASRLPLVFNDSSVMVWTEWVDRQAVGQGGRGVEWVLSWVHCECCTARRAMGARKRCPLTAILAKASGTTNSDGMTGSTFFSTISGDSAEAVAFEALKNWPAPIIQRPTGGESLVLSQAGCMLLRIGQSPLAMARLQWGRLENLNAVLVPGSVVPQ
jgi:hypothetical protein